MEQFPMQILAFSPLFYSQILAQPLLQTTTANRPLNSETTFLPWRENSVSCPNQRCVLNQNTKQPDKVSTRKIQSSPQVIMLMLLHKPTQEGVSGLRHWVHFSRKEIKNPPKYLSTISWKPSAGPLSHYTLWCVTSSIRESALWLSPLQPCLMVRYLHNPRHDVAGRSLQLHIFWASDIVSTMKMKEALSVTILKFREGNKSINTWLSEDKVTFRSSKEDIGIQEDVMVHFINQTLGRPAPIHLLKQILQWKQF